MSDPREEFRQELLLLSQEVQALAFELEERGKPSRLRRLLRFASRKGEG